MLQRGDPLPHFEVTTRHGETFRYASIWQRKNLLLVTLPAGSASADAYAAAVTARLEGLRRQDLECIVTRDPIAGVPAPGVAIADRWGEVVFAAAESDAAGLPSVGALLEWLDYLARRCPECEGEAR